MQVRREKVKELLKSSGVKEEDLSMATDKIYELADILFDLWLKGKERKSHE